MLSVPRLVLSGDSFRWASEELETARLEARLRAIEAQQRRHGTEDGADGGGVVARSASFTLTHTVF